MLLYLTVDTPEHMNMLQTDVDRVSDWISSHHLTLNVAKTKFNQLTQQHGLSQLTPPTIDGEPLEQVSEYTLNNVETYNLPDILLNRNPVERVSDPWCDTSTLLKLYIACVKPHLHYCSFVWDPPLLKDQQPWCGGIH